MSKKKLSKGFEDLFSQNETDLSFLDEYGKTDLENMPGLPESGQDNQSMNELFNVIKKFLKTYDLNLNITNDEILLDDFMLVKKKAKNIVININSKKIPLPLVPSDLMAPGFTSSELSADFQSCSITIISWGIGSKRFISRMIEFYTL